MPLLVSLGKQVPQAHLDWLQLVLLSLRLSNTFTTSLTVKRLKISFENKAKTKCLALFVYVFLNEYF